MNTVNYVLSEGTLSLPEAVQDQSVTLLRLPAARCPRHAGGDTRLGRQRRRGRSVSATAAGQSLSLIHI